MGRANTARAMKNSPLPLKAPKMHSVTQNLESYHSGSFLLFLFPSNLFFFFFFFFLDVLGLHRSAGFSLVAVSRGYSLVVLQGLLIEVASPVAERGL